MKRLIIAVMLITILLFAACSSGSAAKPFTIKMTGATTSPAYTPPATQYTPPTSSYVPPPATTNEPVTLTNVSYAITEQNEIWWRYAWKFTVNNPGSWPINFNAKIQYLDANGFEVDTGYEYGLSVAANSSQDFAGSDLVLVSVAPRVASVKVYID